MTCAICACYLYLSGLPSLSPARLGLATWPSIFLETEAPINWSSFCDGRVEVEKNVQLLLCLHVVTCSTTPGFILITVNLCLSPISEFQVQISANRLVIWHVTWHHLHLLRQCFDGFLLGQAKHEDGLHQWTKRSEFPTSASAGSALKWYWWYVRIWGTLTTTARLGNHLLGLHLLRPHLYRNRRLPSGCGHLVGRQKAEHLHN